MKDLVKALSRLGDPGNYLVSSTVTTATLRGGVYPNGQQTQYWWAYCSTNHFG